MKRSRGEKVKREGEGEGGGWVGGVGVEWWRAWTDEELAGWELNGVDCNVVMGRG